MSAAKHTPGQSIYSDPKAPHQELTSGQRAILDALHAVPLMNAEPNPIVPRLQGRVSQLLRHGRVKDPELMQSAVESLTEIIDAAESLLAGLGQPEDDAQATLMQRLRAAIAKATGEAA